MTHKFTLTIAEFCASHGISRTHFYSLVNEGYGPETMKLGRRTVISLESAHRWREKVTKQSNKELNDGKV